jgi:hypothetical protein
MILLAASSETVAFLIVGVLGIAMGLICYFRPGVFDGATRARLRSQGLPDDEAAVKRDRDRRRLIGSILGVVSAVILVQALAQL